MTLLVDCRQGSSDLAGIEPVRSLLETCPSCSGKGKRGITPCKPCRGHGRSLATLHSGDALIIGRGPGDSSVSILIELKSIFDLIGSLDSGRLQAEQIPKMIESDAEVLYLLYYGNYRAAPETGHLQIFKKLHPGDKKSRCAWADYSIGKRVVPYGYPMGFLASPQFLSTGILSHRVLDLNEAAAWIGVLYRLWQRPYESHKSMQVFNRSQEARARMKMSLVSEEVKDPVKTQIAKTAASFPGVDYTIGMRAGDYFGSVLEMVCAGADEWGKIKGVGKVMAPEIERTIRREKKVPLVEKKKSKTLGK